MKKERYYFLDFLKVIGLICILFSHVISPRLYIRSFDVPLMVIISSILANISYEKKIKEKNYSNKEYIISRFKRLVIPTWIFLVFYFLFQFLIFKNQYTTRYYIDSFLLTRYAIGYVWIILIYLYCSLLVPFFHKIGFSFKSLFLIIGIYILYEIFYYFRIGFDYKIIETTFYYIIPYGFIAYLGYFYPKMKDKRKDQIIGFSFLFFISCLLFYYFKNNTFPYLYDYKYPPILYYLSYGVLISFILLTYTQYHTISLFKSKIITFISKHSLWIYLWHILVLDIYPYLKLPDLWYLKYIVVSIITLSIVYIENKLLDKIENDQNKKYLKYFR